MVTGGRGPVTPLLLARRAAAAAERDVVALLREVPLDAVEVADLMRHHRVFVLSDLTLPEAAPPIADHGTARADGRTHLVLLL